jgi:hypothetical protein
MYKRRASFWTANKSAGATDVLKSCDGMFFASRASDSAHYTHVKNTEVMELCGIMTCLI